MFSPITVVDPERPMRVDSSASCLMSQRPSLINGNLQHNAKDLDGSHRCLQVFAPVVPPPERGARHHEQQQSSFFVHRPYGRLGDVRTPLRALCGARRCCVGDQTGLNRDE